MYYSYLFPFLACTNSQYLIGKGVAHDEGWVSHGTAQVDQSALGQDDDVMAVLQTIAIHLRRRITAAVTVQIQDRLTDVGQHKNTEDNRCQTMNISLGQLKVV